MDLSSTVSGLKMTMSASMPWPTLPFRAKAGALSWSLWAGMSEHLASASESDSSLRSRTYLPSISEYVPAVLGCPLPPRRKPSVAMAHRGLVTAVSTASCGVEWTMTMPPVSRYSAKVEDVSRSPCIGPLEAVVADPVLLLPALAEQRGVNRRHARRVWVALGGHVQTTITRALYHRKSMTRSVHTRTLDVDYMQRSAGYGGCRNHLSGGLDAAHWLLVSLAPNVDMARRTVLGRYPEDLDDLPTRAAARVIQPEPDGQRAALQPKLYAHLDAPKFVWRGLSVSGVRDGEEVARGRPSHRCGRGYAPRSRRS